MAAPISSVTSLKLKAPEMESSPKYPSFEVFSKTIDLSKITTEGGSEKTATLSQTMKQDIVAGLKQLHEVDQTVIDGFNSFESVMMQQAPHFQKCLEKGGRIIFTGAGSSGRLAERLAAKFAEASPARAHQFIGRIAGGKSAMFRPKENFEDSADGGKEMIKKLNVGPNDTVVLTSASGSAKFNIGAGNEAADRGAKVFYFTNNVNTPPNAKALFTRTTNPVVHLCKDIGGPAIGGSTRLQSATVGEACLGTMIGYALLKSVEKHEEASSLFQQISKGLDLIHQEIGNKFSQLKEVIQEQHKIYTSDESDLWCTKDTMGRGYITLVATENAGPEGVIDYVELGPTFEVPYVRRGEDSLHRRPSFQPYVLGSQNNHDAMIKFMGGKMEEEDYADAMQFSICTLAVGVNSYGLRPKGEGNMVFGISKLKACEELPKDLMQTLQIIKDTPKATFFVCEGTLSEEQKEELKKLGPSLAFENIPQDPFGLLTSIAMKEGLNLISNSTMVLAGNVVGNKMINFRFSNDKLVQRSLDTLLYLWEKEKGTPLDKKLLYETFRENELKILALDDKGIQAPPNILITYTMLEQSRSSDDFDMIVHQMNLDRKKGISFSKFE